MEEQSNSTEGGSPMNAAQEILSARDPVSKGNTPATDLISTQPVSTAATPSGASRVAPGHKQAPDGPDEPTCPQCGLPAPAPSRSRPRGSSLSVHGAAQSDSCFRLLLACLWCRCSALLLGLLEACASCLHALCSSCCHACARCCVAVQEAPVEELHCHAHCHSVLFQSCCEPTECLEFCLECCEICHRS